MLAKCILMWPDKSFLSHRTCLHRLDEFKVRIAGNSAFFSNLSGFFEFCFDPFSNDFHGTFHIKQGHQLKRMTVPKETLQGAEECLGSWTHPWVPLAAVSDFILF